MNNKVWKFFLPGLLCTLMMTAVFVSQASAQERPPDWMWGEWRGYDSNARRDCEWYISSDGDAAFGYVGEKRQTGFYRGGRLYLDKYTYSVTKSSNTSMIVKDVNDRNNSIVYRKTSGGGSGGWGGSGGSGGSNRPPDWMVGTFRGYDRNAGKECEWDIDRSGSAKFRYKDSNSQSGSYRDGYLRLDKFSYTVSKSGNGINVKRTDGGSNITYSRVGGGGGWGGSGGSWEGGGGSSRPPDWLIGTFQGYDRDKGEDCRWTINRDGSARFQYLNGKAESGRYNDNKLYLNNYSYNVNKAGSNIAVRRTDGGSAITYHKVRPDEGWGDHDGGGWGGSGGSWGGSGGSNDVVPEWAQGKFRGYDSQSSRDLELSISRDGRVVGEYFQRGNNSSYTSTGNYRDGQLNISGRSYYVSKSGRGITMTRTNDSKVQIQCQRIGN